jgi:succinate dehydrogenase flavin-adding protein (antitoxin of CptAB toxin-antitoxin module)
LISRELTQTFDNLLEEDNNLWQLVQRLQKNKEMILTKSIKVILSNGQEHEFPLAIGGLLDK